MSHWYDHQGFLLPQVEMKTKPGQYREPTLADARKVNALPSVTTILQLLAKPGLVRWQVEQGIKAAMQYDWIMVPDPPTIDKVFRESEEYVHWTADFGTAVHYWLNKKLRDVDTLEIAPMMPGTEEIADGVLDWCGANGYKFTLTEHRFSRTDLGYAGTIDLLGTRYGVPVIVDLKTQEPPLTTYLEHALQLAGYDLGCYDSLDEGGEPWERISLIANRLKPGDIKQHLWVNNEKYDRMFLLLRDFWFLSNNYDPRESDVSPN